MEAAIRKVSWVLVIMAGCVACMRPPRLSDASKYNVTGLLNDTTWFATGKAIRLYPAAINPDAVKQFNLQIITDIDFAGNGSATRSPTVTGCAGDCVPTQRLHLYNIPLKKGRYKLTKLDKKRTVDNERTHYWLLIDGGGVYKEYAYQGARPGWLRITRYDRNASLIEGQFAIGLTSDTAVNLPGQPDRTAQTATFRQGLFRVQLVDVRLKE